MNRKSSSGAGLFLMEMIMVVGFFVLCASICISVFVKANNLSRKAQDTNHSVNMAQSILEVWKAEGPKGLEKHFQTETVEGAEGEYRCAWDAAWTACGGERVPVYYGRLATASEGGVQKMTVTISRRPDGGEPLYELTGARYTGAADLE